jgi:hypothetical protein
MFLTLLSSPGVTVFVFLSRGIKKICAIENEYNWDYIRLIIAVYSSESGYAR